MTAMTSAFSMGQRTLLLLLFAIHATVSIGMIDNSYLKIDHSTKNFKFSTAHDRNAIQVHVGGLMLGHVAKYQACFIAPIMDLMPRITLKCTAPVWRGADTNDIVVTFCADMIYDREIMFEIKTLATRLWDKEGFELDDEANLALIFFDAMN